jgi:hypothetical protein
LNLLLSIQIDNRISCLGIFTALKNCATV